MQIKSFIYRCRRCWNSSKCVQPSVHSQPYYYYDYYNDYYSSSASYKLTKFTQNTNFKTKLFHEIYLHFVNIYNLRCVTFGKIKLRDRGIRAHPVRLSPFLVRLFILFADVHFLFRWLWSQNTRSYKFTWKKKTATYKLERKRYGEEKTSESVETGKKTYCKYCHLKAHSIQFSLMHLWNLKLFCSLLHFLVCCHYLIALLLFYWNFLHVHSHFFTFFLHT